MEEPSPLPHPDARRLWLISTQIDPKEIPLDLVGIDADGLKAAMRNRGLEVEHWALKIDTPATAPAKTEASIFDLTVEGGKLVSQVHATSSAYWKIVLRRVNIGWTIWTDAEVYAASKQLIEARPKYDGRTNNSQILARLLARHIELAPPQAAPAATATEKVVVGEGSCPATSIKVESVHDAGFNNRSQMTLVSGGHSQRSQSIEEEPKEAALSSGESDTVSRVPASIRQSQRASMARPPLIHLSTAPSVAGSDIGTGPMVRPTLHRSADTDHSSSPTSPTGSVRMSLPPQSRQGSTLNPSTSRYRQSVSEVRARTNSDAKSALAYASLTAAERRSTLDPGRSTVGRAGRRRSEAPQEWLAEMPQFNSTRSKRNTQRDSVMSLGSWGPGMIPPAISMANLPMGGGFSPPSPNMMPMGLPWASPSMHFNPGLQVPMPYFSPPPMGMPMGYMPSMPMLAPPSPGFYSHTSSAVNTPPESPSLLPAQGLGQKGSFPDMNAAIQQYHLRA